jgi:hypothetical protein
MDKFSKRRSVEKIEAPITPKFCQVHGCDEPANIIIKKLNKSRTAFISDMPLAARCCKHYMRDVDRANQSASFRNGSPKEKTTANMESIRISIARGD